MTARLESRIDNFNQSPRDLQVAQQARHRALQIRRETANAYWVAFGNFMGIKSPKKLCAVCSYGSIV